MALQIGQALGRGTRRSVSLSGIVLLVAMMFYQLVTIGLLNTIVLNNLPADVSPSEVGLSGFSFPLSTEVAAAIGVVALLFGSTIFLFAARLLTRDLSELGSLPAELFTHRFGRAFLATLVVSGILSIMIPLGLLFFLIPGLFLAVSFQFAIYAIAVEDRGPLAGLRRSWDLAHGNRWRLLAVVLLVGVLTGIGSVVGTVVSAIYPLAGQLVQAATTSVSLVLTYGILADAFLQLRADSTAHHVDETPTL